MNAFNFTLRVVVDRLNLLEALLNFHRVIEVIELHGFDALFEIVEIFLLREFVEAVFPLRLFLRELSLQLLNSLCRF